MAGALSVYFVADRLVQRRRSPWLGGQFPARPSPLIDVRLVGGAALFGIGWGASGFCPGPALVDLGAGAPAAIWFVPGMILGMLAFDRFFAGSD
jgi:uncharacterized membrane protein YedE/YeeE